MQGVPPDGCALAWWAANASQVPQIADVASKFLAAHQGIYPTNCLFMTPAPPRVDLPLFLLWDSRLAVLASPLALQPLRPMSNVSFPSPLCSLLPIARVCPKTVWPWSCKLPGTARREGRGVPRRFEVFPPPQTLSAMKFNVIQVVLLVAIVLVVATLLKEGTALR